MSAPRHIDIKGMHCAACVSKVEQELLRTPGVRSVTVNLVTNRATVDSDDSTADATLSDAVTRAGYTAEAVYTEREQDVRSTEQRIDVSIEQYARSLALAAPLTLAIMATSMLPMLISELHEAMMPHTQFINMLLMVASMVVMWTGRMFYKGAWSATLHRTATMDTLISVGTLASWFMSSVVALAPDAIPHLSHHIGVYFDTTATIVTLVLLGKWLEARAKKKTTESLLALMRLQPTMARVQRNSQVLDIPASEVVVGDIVIIRPGEIAPVDGVVVEGHATFDESMITGESIPIEKFERSIIVGGTLSTMGSVIINAQAVGADTVLAGIIRSVERAQSSKAPIQRVADRISAVFVPVVLFIALCTYCTWLLIGPDGASHDQALVSAIAVLIIACPCALGLATPAAIIVASGAAARRGVLFSSAEALELLEKADAFVLDKTGTITEGRPSVRSVAYTSSASHRDDILTAIAAVEQRSEHPLAHAIVDWTKQQSVGHVEAQTVTNIPGRGTSGTVNSLRVRIGNEAFMMDSLLIIPADLSAFADERGALGETTAFASINGSVCCAISIADTVRSTSQEAIHDLSRLGKTVIIATGDREVVGRAIAQQVGIEQVIHSVGPIEKADAVGTLQRRGSTVVMVGDGINDAPALAQADIGIAIGSGTDIAKQTASITLMKNDLRDVVAALRISQHTMRVIRQNFVFAFAYNILGIPLAAGALLPLVGVQLTPMHAAAAMALSSITVLTNALRLRSIQ